MWSIIYELSDRLDVTKNSASTEVVILLGYPALHYFIFVDKLLQDKKTSFSLESYKKQFFFQKCEQLIINNEPTL